MRPVQYEINPNPRLVALLNFALDEVRSRPSIHSDSKNQKWLAWASSWRNGERSPKSCVTVAQIYLSQRGSNPVMHCLGQLAWAAKEACYDTPKTGWLVLRYIADAMIAFGVAFPEGSTDAVDYMAKIGNT